MRRPDKKNLPFGKISTKKVALAGILLAFSLILALIESYIPPIIAVAPYAKIGFANIVLICVLLLLGYRYCLLILIIKCVFTGIFSGNMFSLAYSIPAGVIAYTVSALLFKCPKFGIIAVSTLSSVIHNLVQVAVASAVIGRNMWLVAPYLLLIGAVSGAAVGLVAFLLLKALPQKFYMELDGCGENASDGGLPDENTAAKSDGADEKNIND